MSVSEQVPTLRSTFLFTCSDVGKIDENGTQPFVEHVVMFSHGNIRVLGSGVSMGSSDWC